MIKMHSILPEKIFGIPEILFRWLYILFFAFAFPIVFLNDSFASFWDHAKFNVPVGIFYSAFITHMVLYISLRMRGATDGIQDVGRNFRLQLGLQILATMLFAVAMAKLLSAVGVGTNDLGYFGRHIAGSLLSVGLILGIYKGTYWFQQLTISISERERLQRLNVQGQMDMLRNQVKPHFLFNSLNTLASIIPEDSATAVEYVENLARIYRYILEMNEKSLIPIRDELNCVRAYVFLLKIRFANNIEVLIAEEDLADDFHVVPLSIQLLVENAVQHNIVSSQRPLQVSIAPSGDFLIVRNNLQLKKQVTKGTGTGLENIRERYRLLGVKELAIDISETHYQVAIPMVRVN